MHFEIRKISIHSIREFTREYLMIVVGILTALGLEHVVTHHQHVRAAEQAQRQIVAELRANLQEVHNAQRQNEALQKRIEAVAKGLKEAIQAGRTRPDLNRYLASQLKGWFSMGFIMPTLRHEAWDVAVANRSAADIDPTALRRFSAAYATQRDSGSLATQGSLSLLEAPRVLDAAVDLDLQRADPVEFLKMLNHIDSAVSSVQSNLAGMGSQLGKTLAGEPGEPGQATQEP